MDTEATNTTKREGAKREGTKREGGQGGRKNSWCVASESKKKTPRKWSTNPISAPPASTCGRLSHQPWVAPPSNVLNYGPNTWLSLGHSWTTSTDCTPIIAVYQSVFLLRICSLTLHFEDREYVGVGQHTFGVISWGYYFPRPICALSIRIVSPRSPAPWAILSSYVIAFF